jgi:cation diffusion facilitator CzcD-associated flavoprotein CzcO
MVAWALTVRPVDGSERVLKPWHVVSATRVSAIPIMPDISGRGSIAGTPMHSAQFQKRKKVFVFLCTGGSGHDVAHDHCNSSAENSMVQCATTMRSLHL